MRDLLAEANNKTLEKVTYEDIESLNDFLQPFSLHTDKLQGDSYPTLLYVEPTLEILLDHCRAKEGDSPGMAERAGKLISVQLNAVRYL